MKSLWDQVRDRAEGRCEYCRLPQSAVEFAFPVDHVRARQHRGETEAANLALSCPRCNAHKGPNVAGYDPATGALTRLFNPRRDRWGKHFTWSAATIVGRTAVGRTTVEVLAMNSPDAVAAREALMKEGWRPAD